MDQHRASGPAPIKNPGAVTFSQQGAAAIVTLPPDSRASDPAFLVSLLDQMQNWARSPDVYAIVLRTSDDTEVSHLNGALAPLGRTAPPDGLASGIAQQLSTFWGIDCLPKPILSLLDGRLTNPCIGLTAFVTHRAASEACQFILPDAGDVTAPPTGGLAHALARIPRGRGAEWALTQRGIGSAEAWAAGLVTHCIPRTSFAAIIAALAEAQPIDPVLDNRHTIPAILGDAPSDSALDRCFGQSSVADCLTALRRETGPDAAWAAAAAASIAAQPPVALAGVQRLLAIARRSGRRDCLIFSHRLAVGLKKASMRSEKQSHDGQPSPADVDRLFEVPEAGDLPLQRHVEIGSERF